jgi:hypothetical protein
MKYLDDRDPSPTETERARMRSRRFDEREVTDAKLRRLFEKGYFVAHKASPNVVDLTI